jgi:hypothetical protein
MDPSIFSFFSPRPADAEMACPLDQTESATATIAGLDLSDPIPSVPSGTTATTTTLTSSYVTPSTISTDLPFQAPSTGKHARPTRTPSYRRDEGPAKKRARIDDSPEFEFESVDYWLRFDEEEMEAEAANNAFDMAPSRRPSEMRVPSRYVQFMF